MLSLHTLSHTMPIDWYPFYNGLEHLSRSFSPARYTWTYYPNASVNSFCHRHTREHWSSQTCREKSCQSRVSHSKCAPPWNVQTESRNWALSKTKHFETINKHAPPPTTVTSLSHALTHFSVALPNCWHSIRSPSRRGQRFLSVHRVALKFSAFLRQ